MATTPNPEDLHRDMIKLRNAADLGAAKTQAARAADEVNKLYAARNAAIAIVQGDADLNDVARGRKIAEINAKYQGDVAKASQILAGINAQMDEIEPLVQRADVHHLERVVHMKPEELTPLLLLAQRLPDHLLAVAARAAVVGDKTRLASVLYLDAQARDIKSLYVADAIKTLGALPDEALAASQTIRETRGAISLSIAKARELSGGAPVTSIDKITAGLAEMSAAGDVAA